MRAYTNSEIVPGEGFGRNPGGKRRGICVERKCASVFEIPTQTVIIVVEKTRKRRRTVL
jgi:hypothetical protein